MPTANSCRTRPYNNICHFWFITGQAQVLLVYGFSLHPYKARAGQESNLTASASRCHTHHYRPQCAGSCGDTRQRCLGHFYPPFFNTHRVEPQIGCVGEDCTHDLQRMRLPSYYCSTTLYYWAGVLTLPGRHSTSQPATTKRLLLSKHLRLCVKMYNRQT